MVLFHQDNTPAHAALLKQLVEVDLLHCFDRWKTRMQHCVDAEGEYTGGEGPNITE